MHDTHSFIKKFTVMKNLLFSLAALALLACCSQGCESKENAPLYAKVTKVVVKQFPVTNGSAFWDGDSDPLPELYIRFWDKVTDAGGTPVMIYEYPSFIDDADPGATHTFDLAGSDVRFYPGLKYRLSLYDEDDLDDPKIDFDIVEGIDFVAYETGEEDPVSPIVLAKDGTVFEVYVDYVK